MTSRDVRTNLVEALQLDLIGPDNDHLCAHELLPESPYKWYLTGYLMSTKAPEEIRWDETSDEEIDQAGESGTDDDGPIDRAPGGKSFLPSSIGMSVLLAPGSNELKLIARWGDYIWESEQEETSDGPDAVEEAEEGGDGKGGAKKIVKGYRRECREESITIDTDGIATDDLVSQDVPNSGGLTFSIIARELKNCSTLGLPQGARAFTVFLVNYRKTNIDRVYRSCAFQAQLELVSEKGFLNQPDLRGIGADENTDWDEKLADLQYRDVQGFAAGHGIATVDEQEDGTCNRVRTTWLPDHEVERVAPNTDIAGVEFGMKVLSELSDSQAVYDVLSPLVDQYETWIAGQESILPTLSKKREEVGTAAIADARKAKERMLEGLEAVKNDGQAFEAFRIMNRTIARAAWQRFQQDDPDIKLEDLKWRPFQLAFILLNLPGIVNDRATDRETVDLLFFPTGGGKTEAYLGLAAFTMVLRRLRNPGVQGCGLSVLMRYTLRLLTLDQLGRAAGLMCALELEREDNMDLGAWPFEIGLWVGSGATPNKMGGRKFKGRGSEYTAYSKLMAFKGDPTNPNNPCPIPLEKCPWCGTSFTPNSFRLTPNQDTPTDLKIGCVNRKCDFTKNRSLPILSVDEPIYRRLPAFLIATVDKFAALPWEGRAGTLLGHVDRQDKEGFYGPMDQGKGKSFGGPLPGPDLIIQDELHLISGPLGTIAGVYETAIESLASRDGVKPKIVASTATVRRAEAQIQALFGRSSSKVFPPQGPDIRDTFFAKTESIEESNGRLYLGVAAQGRSLKVILLRSALALLCAAQKQFVDAGGEIPKNPADPYMTLMGYFNSLRELGGSRRIIEDEVVSQAAKYSRRLRRDPKLKYFANRMVDYEPRELTSRVSTNKVAKTKDLLDNPFDGSHDTVDVALATNMISVGLDITRLGLMVVLGQPKGSSEYIQATSRVGRDKNRPGLVVTLLNVHRPRDRSHYEYFGLYHKTFYRSVEATSVTPFSPRSLDRALAAALVGVCRHSLAEMTPALGASAIATKRAELEKYAKKFAGRAKSHRDGDAKEMDKLYDDVLHKCNHLLDVWMNLQKDRESRGVMLEYQDELRSSKSARLLHDFLHIDLPQPQTEFRKFRANRSMRDVEPNVELRVKAISEPLKSSDDGEKEAS